MALEDEVDIYGDYDFGEGDDILDEIVNDKPTVKRLAENPIEEEKVLKAPRIEEKQAPQKIHTTTISDTISIPAAIMQLRGITTNPTHCIYLGELHWYTTDKQVKSRLIKAKLIDHVKEMTFFEQKMNGKSKGIVFFEFSNKNYAAEAKSVFEKTELDHKKVYVVYTTSPNPFKHLSKDIGTNHNKSHNNRNNIPRMNNTIMTSNFQMPAAAFNTGNYNMPPYTFPSQTMRNNNGGGPMRSNNMMRQQNYQPFRNNNNMNDGAGFGGMYINPAFFDPSNGGGGSRQYRNN